MSVSVFMTFWLFWDLVGGVYDWEHDEDEASGRGTGRFSCPSLLPSLVRVSGTGADVSMN